MGGNAHGFPFSSLNAFMKKRFLKRSEVLREGYNKGLRKAYRVISESLEGERADLYQNNPFIDTDEWDGLS